VGARARVHVPEGVVKGVGREWACGGRGHAGVGRPLEEVAHRELCWQCGAFVQRRPAPKIESDPTADRGKY